MTIEEEEGELGIGDNLARLLRFKGLTGGINWELSSLRGSTFRRELNWILTGRRCGG